VIDSTYYKTTFP